MKVASTINFALIAFSFAALATVSEIKVFESWSQVSILWTSEINPMQIVGHPHMPRYLIAYPGFLLEDHLPGIGFSLYISVFFALNFVFFREVALLAIQGRPSISVYLCFAAIHFGMNGRGVIVWTAWLMCIWVCHKIIMRTSHPANHIFWIAISCFLATVSTGVFIIVTIALSLIALRGLSFMKKMSPTRWLILLVMAVPLGYKLLGYFIMAIEKNIDFYGGGIEGVFNMFEHGLGIIFFEIDQSLSLIIFFMIFSAGFIMVLLVGRKRFLLLDRFAVLSILGGFFGFTVLSMTLPLLLLKIQKTFGFLKKVRLKSKIYKTDNSQLISRSDKILVTYCEVESKGGG